MTQQTELNIFRIETESGARYHCNANSKEEAQRIAIEDEVNPEKITSVEKVDKIEYSS